MQTVTSKDGTTIAFDNSGSGPAVILVDGALGSRGFESGLGQLAALLSEQFTVYHYDRRGRGDSGDHQPYALEREIEDIEALIDHAGGSAFMYGISSGAALAMEAALKLGDKMKKLAMYEAPYNDDPQSRRNWVSYVNDIKGHIAAGRGDEAVLRFMMLVGMSPNDVPGVREEPWFALLAAMGHTLLYDAAALGDQSAIPHDKAARVSAPTLVVDGRASFPFMHTAADALAVAMPDGEQLTLDGQTHDVQPEVLAPLLIDFFKS